MGCCGDDDITCPAAGCQAGDLDGDHELAFKNRAALLRSTLAACFCCCQVFPVGDVAEYCDAGETPLCPLCGVDSVVGDAQHPLSPQWLGAMERHWFGLAERTATGGE